LMGGVYVDEEGEMLNALQRRVRKVLAGATGAGALLFAYWGVGGKWGMAAASGPAFSPPPVLMWTTALCLGAWTVFVLGPAGVGGGDAMRRWSRLVCCVISIALLLIAATFLQSEDLWARIVCGPVTLLLAAAAALLVRDETPARRLFS
jgi:hypothetical protein